MSPSKILFFLCISFVLGIFLESVYKIPQIFIWGFLLIGVLLIFIFLFFKKDVLIIAGFCLLFLIVGILRFQISEFNIANDKLSKLNGKGEVVLTGLISDEPDVRDTSQKLDVKVGDSIILVTTQRYPEYKYLGKVKLTGKLETPSVTDNFNYKNYLQKDGIYSVMNFARVEVAGKAKPNVIQAAYSGVLGLKGKLRQSLQKSFSPPQLFIIQGMVLGDKTAIPQDLKQKLSVTGVSHIIAVSGTHVVIITAILMSLLIFVGLKRGQAFYFSVVLICFYIILVGLPASGVRAGIMGIIFLFGQKLGRQNSSSRIIVLAAALMLLQNPLLLFYDVGFQLSFMAVLALIYLEPTIRFFFKILLEGFFKKEIIEKYDKILMMFSATLAAQIFTLPVIIYNFGNISFVSPIANILLLPIADLLMIFGFLSALAGIVFNYLGWILSIPAYLLLVYFIGVVNFFSKPWAFKTIENVHWAWLFVSYLVLSFTVRYLRKKIALY
ncbi:MAG: ComEC/Rec2 family competence protein [Candidatus Staskawiczbacteria bacterium]|nr:ComEC/Rec2 family competence protein [Candidatus Staskawiczbacteria bacterium]